MKPDKVGKEIGAIVSGIEDIVKQLQLAAAKLQAAETRLSEGESGDGTLAALKEARVLVRHARKRLGK